MKYLFDSIDLSNRDIIIIREKKSRLIECSDCSVIQDIEIPRLREYYNNTIMGTLISFLYSCYIFLQLIYKHRKITFISTGPGFCIPFLLGSRLLGMRFLYFENSCRYLIRSYTGIFNNIFANYMFVQNTDSKSIYKNAIFCGQLMNKFDRDKKDDTIQTDIFVTTGSTLFDELFDHVDSLPSSIRQRITCQTGPSKKKPNVYKNIQFVDNIDEYYHSSNIVVCHAGAGTVFRLLELNKKIIVIPNLSRIDNHQIDLANFIRINNLGLVLNDLTDLSESLVSIQDFSFEQFKPKKFFIQNYINEILL